jgi:putative transposase
MRKSLAKSINDAGWSQLRKWIEYFGIKYGRLTIAVNPAYTIQVKNALIVVG